MKKKRKRRITFIIFIILLLALIGGAYYYFIYLGNDIPLVEKKEELNVYDVNSNKRPIAVMIDNNVENDEQVGLQDAYLTYEIIVEGGLTRIMAIYKDVDTSVIGPVRSSRHYFLDYALENDAIYAHYGWSTYAENDIKASKSSSASSSVIDSISWPFLSDAKRPFSPSFPSISTIGP